MKYIVTIMSVILLFMTAQSQEISRSVESTAGGSYASGGKSMEFVIGEPVTANYANGGYMISQGFIQGNLIITSVEPESFVDIQVWPNPVGTNLFVKYDSDELQNPELVIYDNNGRVLKKQRPVSDRVTIDFSAYPSGAYILEIAEGTERVKTIQLIKK
ncbi:MAG: T9SS type A sorting domain-containing protein [Bacteroidota bacterium]